MSETTYSDKGPDGIVAENESCDEQHRAANDAVGDGLPWPSSVIVSDDDDDEETKQRSSESDLPMAAQKGVKTPRIRLLTIVSERLVLLEFQSGPR